MQQRSKIKTVSENGGGGWGERWRGAGENSGGSGAGAMRENFDSGHRLLTPHLWLSALFREM